MPLVDLTPGEATAPHGERVGHRLVFSANPGRSGSGFLARLLDTSPSIDAGHERDPALTGPWVRRVAFQGHDESSAERMIKLDVIARECAHLADGMIYADTSHLFVTTFADIVLDAVDHELVSIIVLRRDPVLVARSYFTLGTLGPNEGPWHGWHAAPSAPAMRFRLDRSEITNQFDLIFGTLVDSVARTNDLRTHAPGVTWIDVWLDQLTTGRGAADLFRQLGVPVPESLDDVPAAPVNVKRLQKDEVDLDVSTDLVTERLREFVHRFRSRPEVDQFIAHFELERNLT